MGRTDDAATGRGLAPVEPPAGGYQAGDLVLYRRRGSDLQEAALVYARVLPDPPPPFEPYAEGAVRWVDAYCAAVPIGETRRSRLEAVLAVLDGETFARAAAAGFPADGVIDGRSLVDDGASGGRTSGGGLEAAPATDDRILEAPPDQPIGSIYGDDVRRRSLETSDVRPRGHRIHRDGEYRLLHLHDDDTVDVLVETRDADGRLRWTYREGVPRLDL